MEIEFNIFVIVIGGQKGYITLSEERVTV